MSSLERLTKAREFLAANGWVQKMNRATRNGVGYAYCAQGALMYGAYAGPDGNGDPYNLATGSMGVEFQEDLKALNAAIPPPDPGMYDAFTSPLVAYNDTPGRTKDEVLAVFDKAVETLRGGS